MAHLGFQQAGFVHSGPNFVTAILMGVLGLATKFEIDFEILSLDPDYSGWRASTLK